jgi:hypothetical protein
LSRPSYSRWWLASAFVAGLATVAVVVIWRSFPWLMAVFSGAAVGALVFMTLQTAARVRAQFRRDG